MVKTRTASLEYIDDLMDALVERRDRLNTEIDRLRDLRGFVLDTPLATKTVADPILTDEVWSVASRSGGIGHYVHVEGPVYAEVISCTCEAGRNGRQCWAIRGMENYRFLHDTDGQNVINFFDPVYNEEHTAWRLHRA